MTLYEHWGQSVCTGPESKVQKGHKTFVEDKHSGREEADQVGLCKLGCTSVCIDRLPNQAIQPENKVHSGESEVHSLL